MYGLQFHYIESLNLSYIYGEMSTSLILSPFKDEPVILCAGAWSPEPGGDHCDHAEPGQWSPLTALC